MAGETAVTVHLPEKLYRDSQWLVEAGFHKNLDEVIWSGLQLEIALHSPALDDIAPPGLTDGERMAFYLEKLRSQIRAQGGLHPGKTPEEVIETLRRTREEIWEEKYAAHFGYK